MKISLSKFGFCGIVAQDLQSWKDTTIIGWFTTMTMIRNILIITVIAALVPTAMSSVSASADSEIALFSRASVDTDSLSITGNGDSAKMELKATNDNGKSNRVSDFQLTADNVLSTEVGDKVTVKDNVDLTKAITTDARNNQKAIGITSNGVIDFAGYTQDVYTLDVVVDDNRAYEAIIAIGDQTNQIVDKEITRVNSEYTTKIDLVYPPIEDPKPAKDNHLPYCDLVSDDYKGSCHDRKDNGEGGLFTCRDHLTKVKDWRDCKDAGEHPLERLRESLGDLLLPNSNTVEASNMLVHQDETKPVQEDEEPGSEAEAEAEAEPTDEEIIGQDIEEDAGPDDEEEEQEEEEQEESEEEQDEESGGSEDEEDDEGSEQESQGGN